MAYEKKAKPVVTTKRGKALNLTWTEARVLNAMRAFMEEHGHPPSRKELIHISGWTTHGPVWRTLRALERKGALKVHAYALPVTLL